RHHLSLRDRRYTVEVERSERLAGGHAGFRHVALDTTPATISNLVLRGCPQEAGGKPALLFGPGRQRCAYRLHAKEPRLVEQQLDAGGIYRVRCAGHAAAPELEFAGVRVMLTNSS